MHWLRCVLAEWQLLRARLVRSRLGLWLLLLSGGGAWLATRGAPLTILAPHLAMLGAVLGVAFSVGSDVDRAAVALTLTSVVVLELLPGVWRYEALASGDPVGWAHAACWVVGGVAGTAQLFARRAV